MGQGLYDLKNILIWSNMAKVAEMYERYLSYPLQSRVYGIYSELYSIHPVGLSPSVWNITQGGVTMGEEGVGGGGFQFLNRNV